MVLPSDSLLTQMRKGVLEPCVLALLRERPRYGTEIAAGLRAEELLTSEGTLYPLLARLRKQGLVETRWEQSQIGPPRRYYALTEEGEAQFRIFAQVWQPFSKSVSRLLKEKP